MSADQPKSNGSSPYSTGGGGVRLEHSYAACLIAGLLAEEVLTELGDAILVDSIRLQASDISAVDDIVVEGRDTYGRQHRASIAVRRKPLLTSSDSASVPLIRDFLSIVTDRWSEVREGRWSLVLAASTNSSAFSQLGELANIARSVATSSEMVERLNQPGRTNAAVRKRYSHLKHLVDKAAEKLASAEGLTSEERMWRFLSHLSTRNLRLEGTNCDDRTLAVNTLKRTLVDGTPAIADAMFSRLEELVKQWAPQGAILTKSLVRQRLSDYPLARSTSFTSAWRMFDRLGNRLREAVRPALQSGLQSLELERPEEKSSLIEAMRSVGGSTGALVVTGDPDVGKSALSLRAMEALEKGGASIISLSLRDLPLTVTEFETQLGGHSLGDIMTGGAGSSVRLIHIDGAESVLEGKEEVFCTLTAASLRAGFGVVAVTRTDGLQQVQDTVRRALNLAQITQLPELYTVEPLTYEECQKILKEFTLLSRFSADTRANWVIRRPGLIDALLRSGAVDIPNDSLCEADVFSAVWQALVRRNENYSPRTASPDDREQVALNVVRRALGLAEVPLFGTAAAELRSDGLLRQPANPAFASGNEFTTDLFRDFALCRLFITEGWDILNAVDAPRWSIRAARLGCQTELISSGCLNAWLNLQASFDEIAKVHGNRWSEVPYEALLAICDGEQALRELWESFTDNESHNLRTLLRIAESRCTRDGVGDPFALAPLVKIAFCGQPNFERSLQLGYRTVKEVIRNLVLAWLRGMATINSNDPLRQEVRDLILADNPLLHDEFAIEALSCLGADIDDKTESWLRQVSRSRPESLHAAVESVTVATSLAQVRPDLLLNLAEAYYISAPSDPSHYGHHFGLDEGIRSLRHGPGIGFGVPAAAWYYGPFISLLNTVPGSAISFINRMLNHAARTRVQHSYDLVTIPLETSELEGIELDITGSRNRRYIGDSHVWAWYRGSSVGPYPCMSALLAVEQFIDNLFEKCDVPAKEILEWLLRDCHNLAVPGLIVGFLTRHLGQCGNLLDSFLVRSEIWLLEISRVTGEYFHVRDPDADKLTGFQWRGNTLQDTVAQMVINAHVRGDKKRLADFIEIGTQLVNNSKELITGGPDNDEYIATVEGWAAGFNINNYRTRQTSDGVLIEVQRPNTVEHILSPINKEMQKINLLYTFQNRYGLYNTNPANWPVKYLDQDLSAARTITEEQTELNLFGNGPESGLVAVAAAAVHAQAMGHISLGSSDLAWAADIIVKAGEAQPVDETAYGGSMYPMGSDRAAAASVPLLLLPVFDGLGLDRSRTEQCLQSFSISHFDEVRANFVNGALPVWGTQCDIDEATNFCRQHKPVWDAVIIGLADCRLGLWNQELQQRDYEKLQQPFDKTLLNVPDSDLLVNKLRMPLACMVDARKVPCLQNEIAALWSPLWNAHQRGLTHIWRERYDYQQHIQHEPIARRMIEIFLEGDCNVVSLHIESFATNPNALYFLFDGFAKIFTYDEYLRAHLADFWPNALKIALDAIEDGDLFQAYELGLGNMIAVLLPKPTLKPADSDATITLSKSRDAWIQPDALGELSERWLRIAKGHAEAVDAVISFAKGTSPEWQTTLALDWIETILDGHSDIIANHVWLLEEWLTDLRSYTEFDPNTKNLYHRIVDSLAAAGDRGAVRLQQLDE